MTIYRYYCWRCSPIGNVPELATLHDVCPFEEVTRTERGLAYGYADYTAPLTDEQIKEFMLTRAVVFDG